MSRIHHLIVAELVLAGTSDLAVAQRADPVGPVGATTSFAWIAPPLAARAPGDPAPVEDEGRSSAFGTAFRAVVGVGGGAILGGWLGYFTSQVGRSDWDELPSDRKSSLRRGYAISGAGVGGVVGYFMRPRPAAARRGLPQPGGVPARTGRMIIASGDLRRTIATTVLEAVEMERPEWIASLRQDQAHGDTARTSAPTGASSIVVYVGDVKVGGLESLRDMSIPEVVELRFYDARDARRRWGEDHKYGAIEVVPAVPTSPGAGG
jgi:hypothetical protein